MELTEEDLAQCNAKVDYMLKQTRTNLDLPEIYLPYGEICEQEAGLRMCRRTRKDWIKTFSEWMDAGYTPEDVRQAVRAIHNENKILICRPGTITHRLDGEAAKRRISANSGKKYIGGAFADFIEH